MGYRHYPNERDRPLTTQGSLIEVCLTANEPQTLVDKFSHSTKILDAEYKPAVLDEVIKMCENLNQEEQHQLLQILKNMNISLMEH